MCGHGFSQRLADVEGEVVIDEGGGGGGRGGGAAASQTTMSLGS